MRCAFRPLLQLLLALLLGTAANTVLAQGIESILSPGKLIQGHAKYEDDCAQCHVKFDRRAQDNLCMNCHKDVGADVRARTGFHGKSKPQACKSCHTDHKGRDVKIAAFDHKTFDHALTDYALKGKHQQTACEKCHIRPKKFRDAPQTCNACHSKDDVHKTSLGIKCADCHNESNWKQAKFDHDTARFTLRGKHADAKCADCHKSNNYREAPRICIGCHKKDDDQKGHKGQYGEKCESCHGVTRWKPSSFNHDADTRFSLRGKHRSSACSDCHTGPLYKTKLRTDCYSCHKKDDKHDGSLGRECGSCHTERNWKESNKFDHETSSFPLLGAHAKAECKACHKSAVFKDAPRECIGCHKKDDKHKGTLGDKCGDCHREQDWKTTSQRFDHDKTRFPLRNAHAKRSVQCSACHKDLASYKNAPTDCFSCHKKDDKHEGQQGEKCAQCHTDRDWKVERFDHSKTRYPLTGRHAVAACKGCHETPRFKDAPQDCYSCHKKQDQHKLKFGTACQECHNTRAWSIWEYDHTRRAKYVLDGAHGKARCETCHTKPAPSGKMAAPVGTTCVSCHRAEDVHDGQFGNRCDQCHVTDNWKKFKLDARIPAGGKSQ
jgi:hypothetical protein